MTEEQGNKIIVLLIIIVMLEMVTMGLQAVT